MPPRIALVGLGDAGRHHARALADQSWSAAVVRDPVKRATLPPNVAAFDSLEALLKANVCDAVILATPDGLHAAQVEQVAAAGLDVLVEKPLALSHADARRAVDAARAANVHLAVGYQLRHHAAHRQMLERLPQLGTLRSIHLRWAWPDPAVDGWRARGDNARFWALAALGTHCIDLALMFTQAKPQRIACTREPADGIDRAAELSFVSGAALVHVSVAVTHRARSRLLLTGDKGELEAHGTLGARGEGDLLNGTFTPVNPYLAQLRAFASRVGQGFTDDPSLLWNLEVLDHA